MKLNRAKIFEVMNKYCAGNYNRFARELAIDPAHLHRFLNTGVGGGKKVVFAILKFCKENKIDSDDIIILD